MTDKVKVLLIDDEANVLAGLKRQLRGRFDVSTAEGGEPALDLVKSEGPFAVAVCDMRMPGMNGIDVLGALKKATPDTVRIMLTGNADQQTAIDAVNQGNIFRFYTKPCPPETLAKGIEAGIQQYRLVTAERELLAQTLAGSVRVLSEVLSMIDPEAFGRATKLRDWAQRVAVLLGLPHPWQLEIAAMLSPIGEVAVPPELLAKKRAGEKLTPVEEDIIARVPETGRQLIENIPRMKAIAEIVYYQNKGFDGSGFPGDGASGTDIPVGARVLKVLNDLAGQGTGLIPSARAFAALEHDSGRYDPKILARVRKYFATQTEQAAEKEDSFAELPVSGLLTGHLLKSDLKLDTGRLILAAGSTLTEAQIAKVRNLNKICRFEEPVRVKKLTAPA